MLHKFSSIAAAAAVALLASSSVSHAGTEMIDNSGAPAPASTYNYAPPRVRYILPPPPPVVVYPAYYYRRPVVAYGYYRSGGRPYYGHRGYRHHSYGRAHFGR